MIGGWLRILGDVLHDDSSAIGRFKDIPAGSRVCDVTYANGHFFLCPLMQVICQNKQICNE